MEKFNMEIFGSYTEKGNLKFSLGRYYDTLENAEKFARENLKRYNYIFIRNKDTNEIVKIVKS